MRASQAEELNNPYIRNRLFTVAQNEWGGQGEQVMRGGLETVLSRAKLDGTSVLGALQQVGVSKHGYYPAVSFSPVKLKYDAWNNRLADVMAGSNYSNYGTGNSSYDPRLGRVVGFSGGPRTAVINGEYFGQEGRHAGWQLRMGWSQPGQQQAGAPDKFGLQGPQSQPGVVTPGTPVRGPAGQLPQGPQASVPQATAPQASMPPLMQQATGRVPMGQGQVADASGRVVPSQGGPALGAGTPLSQLPKPVQDNLIAQASGLKSGTDGVTDTPQLPTSAFAQTADAGQMQSRPMQPGASTGAGTPQQQLAQANNLPLTNQYGNLSPQLLQRIFANPSIPESVKQSISDMVTARGQVQKLDTGDGYLFWDNFGHHSFVPKEYKEFSAGDTHIPMAITGSGEPGHQGARLMLPDDGSGAGGAGAGAGGAGNGQTGPLGSFVDRLNDYNRQQEALNKATEEDTTSKWAPIKQARDAQQQNLKLRGLLTEYKSLNQMPGTANIWTGPQAEAWADWAARVNAWVGRPVITSEDTLTAAQVLRKLSNELSGAKAKDITSRPTQYEFTAQQKNMPGLETSTDTRNFMVNMMLSGVDRDIALGVRMRALTRRLARRSLIGPVLRFNRSQQRSMVRM
jgi:hypothetical protein